MVNPTSCQAQTLSGSIVAAPSVAGGTSGTSASAQAGFTPTGCAGLAFSPAIVATLGGATSTATGASLSVAVDAEDRPGQPAVGGGHAALDDRPTPSTSIRPASPRRTTANPANCPAASDVGTATAVTPVLTDALTGPVYLVAQPGAMPALDLTLSADGVSIDLSGAIAIGSAGLTTTFSSIPDVPMTNFTLTLPAGPNSALTTTDALTCSSAPSVSTTATSHSGQTASVTNTAQISGCATTSSAGTSTGTAKGSSGPAKWLVIAVLRIKRLKHHAVRLYLRLPTSGKLVLSSRDIVPVKVWTSKKSRYVWVTIRLTKYGTSQMRHHRRLKVKMRAGFRTIGGTSGWVYKSVTLL